MKHLIDFAIDALDGCVHSCFGCQVIKENNRSVTEEEALRLHAFFLSQINHKNIPKECAIIEVGPTDFLVSHNRLEVFECLKDVIGLFDMVQVSSAMNFKNEKLKDLLIPLAPYFKGKKIRLAVPLHPNNYHNQKFYDLVDKNVKTMLEVFEGASINNIAFQFNVVDIQNEKDWYKTLLAKQSDIIKDIDVVVQYGRSDLNEINNKMGFKASLRILRELHNRFDLVGESEFNPLSTLYVEDMLQGYTNALGKDGKIERHYAHALFYYKGKMYRPFSFGEKVNVIDNAFAFDFDGKNPNFIEETGAQLLAKQMMMMDEECSDCAMATVCLENNNVLTKVLYGGGKCILPKEKMVREMKNIPLEPDTIRKDPNAKYYIDRFNPEKMA